MPRYAILVEGNFDYLDAKTGNAMLRYRPEEVACVIDSRTAGKTAREILGWGEETPIVSNLEEALKHSPDALLIGTAPPGGRLPEAWRKIVILAIRHKLDIVAGLHTFLSDDPEFASLAARYGVDIVDLRRPPGPLPFSKGSWRQRKTPVLLTVGSDCNTGKMVTAWEITRLLEKRGKRSIFVGTGQTGILLGGFGVAVDAVVGDYVAGSMEAEIDKVQNENELVVVEGQGSLTHAAYSGVTLGLLHGTMPDMMVMCHEPTRKTDSFGHPMFPVEEIMDLYSKLVNLFRPSEFVGLSLITQGMSVTKAKDTIENFEKDYRLPAADFFRFGGENIADHICSLLDSHPS